VSARDRNVVAFFGHLRATSWRIRRARWFIRYSAMRSATSGAQVILLRGSPAFTIRPQGARVLAGPGAQQLAAICSSRPCWRTALRAGDGGRGAVDAFFTIYRLKLSLENGRDGGHAAGERTSDTREYANTAGRRFSDDGSPGSRATNSPV